MTLSHVYDTYAKTSKGRIMHFDVILDDNNPEKALHYAKQWLNEIGEPDAQVSAKSCCFCHSTEASENLRREIDTRGYAIYKLEGCPA